MSLTRNQIMEHLDELGNLQSGDPMPSWLPLNSWGAPLSELLRGAIDLIPRWQPIATAPIPSEAELRALGRFNSFRFYCLIQDNAAVIRSGHARYTQRNSAAKLPAFDLRWYGDDKRWISNPKYWMPLPAAKED